MASPTFDETDNDLIAVLQTAQSALYELVRIRGRNDLQSDKQLMQLVLATSKAILARLPCLQLEEDAIKEMDSKYSNLLTKMQETRL
jgi:hypothetical protein